VEHYVTLFDSSFLPQGIALHASMERHCRPYRLWILCIDQITFDRLSLINLSNTNLLNLVDLEDSELRDIRVSRTLREYCWTLTPISIRFVMEADKSIERVTYVDADCWFRKSPEPIFNELVNANKSVLITDHCYAPEYDTSVLSGQFCVQFLTFICEKSEPVRSCWESQCREWCYAREEAGKFGDQKYLDQWPTVFSSLVQVAENKEWFLAPWNATRFPYGNAIFWHFQGLRLFKRGSSWRVFLGTSVLPKPVRKFIYGPYLDDLRYAISLLNENGIPVKEQMRMTYFFQIKNLLRGLSDVVWRINQNPWSSI
jgi:hypothetical protein